MKKIYIALTFPIRKWVNTWNNPKSCRVFHSCALVELLENELGRISTENMFLKITGDCERMASVHPLLFLPTRGKV